MTPITDKSLFEIVDVETTGLSSETDKVVEFASVIGGFSGIHDLHERLCNPGIPIPPAASAIHHIVDADVVGLECFKPPVRLLDGCVCFAAHNAAFDDSFCKFTYPVICTMRLAQKLYPDLEGFSNQYLRYYFKLKPPLQPKMSIHRALPDAIVTYSLLIHELKEVISRASDPSSVTVEKLVEWIAKPMLLRRIRFGKHGPKDGQPGALWSTLPKDYLQWIVSKASDFDVDTVHTARYYLDN